MDLEEIAQRLELLGIERAEARAYVHIAMSGGCKASELALSMKCSRTEAYRHLRALADRGFAITTLDRPVRFTARPLGQVLDRLMDEHGAKSHAIEAARGMVPIIETLRAEPSSELEKAKFRIVVGRPEILKAIMHIIAEARTEISVIATHLPSTPATEYPGISDLIAGKLADGLQVRVLRSPFEGKADTPLGRRMRVVTTERDVRFIICDGRQMVIFVVSDPTTRLSPDDEVAIVTTAPDLVFAETLLFEELWRRSAAPHAAA
jgi:sugar-specific transcriptional regulator TrmB